MRPHQASVGCERASERARARIESMVSDREKEEGIEARKWFGERAPSELKSRVERKQKEAKDSSSK